MYCRKCGRDIPDNLDTCPVCGVPTRQGLKKLRNTPTKIMIRFLDILSMIMTLIHAFLWATASHFVRGTANGLLYERQVQYWIYPTLKWIDGIFALLLIAIPAFSVLMRYNLMRERQVGRIFLGITVGLSLLWGIQYPLVIHYVTGIASPVMGFCWIQALVYAALAAYPTIHLLRSEDILY